MKNIMTYLQFSPLYPPDESGQALKGRIAANIRLSRLANIKLERAGGEQIRQ